MTATIRRLIRIVESSMQGDPTASEAFRRWFGHSKVVDVEGRPLVVYHGSNAHAYVGGEIDIFHTLPASGRGAAFFSSSIALAREYGEKVYSVYLRIENPLTVFGDGKSWTTLDHTAKIAGRVTDQLRAYHQKRADEINAINAIYADLALLDGDEASPPVKSRIPDDTHELDQFQLGGVLPDLEGDASTDMIVKLARRMGYDGVIFREIVDSPTHDRRLYSGTPSDVYAVFSPRQIKSVDNDGTWDRDNPEIRY